MASAFSRAGLVRRLAAPSCVQPEALNVASDLVGVPLASPARRAWAMGVDLLVIALLSSTGSFWIAAGIAALVFQLRRRQRERSGWRNAWLWLAIALLAFVAAQRVTQGVERWFAPPQASSAKGPPGAADGRADVDADSDDGDGDAARKLLGTQAAATLLHAASPASAASGVAVAAEPAAATATPHEAQLAARVAQLESELAEARKPRPARWRDEVVKQAHRIGLGFGWAIAYFTLLPFWWNGQTVGKKLFGLRVVQLTGKPLTVITCFGRYGGYAAGMATGATGFLQVLWDSNRQAIQDKIAHTVVVDLREARTVVVVDAAAAPADVEQPAPVTPREGVA